MKMIQGLKLIFGVAGVFLAGCGIPSPQAETGMPSQTIHIPFSGANITIDGKLNEAVYLEVAPFEKFVVASEPDRVAPSTKAWLFWSEERLVCAFQCIDLSPASQTATEDEHAVDGQDRVELFIWDGNPNSEYYCIEVASKGAVHDYSARFYRVFDDEWNLSADEWAVAVAPNPDGYTVEFSLPRAVIESMAVTLASGSQFRCGLFRADFERLNGEPIWITLVDHGREPDFHVADSFGIAELAGE